MFTASVTRCNREGLVVLRFADVAVDHFITGNDQ
jgi:hypothetical protein